MQTATKLCLFAVRNLAGEIVQRGFDDKARAKEARDEMAANEGGQYFVTYDRDHRKYQGAR